ncbi:hypothetical protein SLA2020_378720 [Shorea laevis]
MKEKNVGAFPNPNKTKKHRRTAKEEETETQHITTRVCMEDRVVTQSLTEMGFTKDKAKRLIALALSAAMRMPTNFQKSTRYCKSKRNSKSISHSHVWMDYSQFYEF